MHALPVFSRPPFRRALGGLALSLGALMSVHSAHAGALQVSPVRVQFDAAQHAQSLQVANKGAQVLDAQVRVMRWTQENNEDRLVPADDIVVSPAILRVASGQAQTVRLIRVQPGPADREHSYRVLVDELPANDPGTPRTGLKVLMRYSIPVFVAPAAPKPPAGKARATGPALTDLSGLQASFAPGAQGKSELHVKNNGARYVRISHLSVTAPGAAKPQVLLDGLVGYVLPGQQMSWPVGVPHDASKGATFKAVFNDDRQAQALPLGGAGR